MAASDYKDTREPDKVFSEMKIVAQDPSVTVDGRPLMATVRVPIDRLDRGPRGHRLRVIDYDSSSSTFAEPADIDCPDERFPGWGYRDPFSRRKLSEADLLRDDPGRRIRCQNVYAIAARTLAEFEIALGRRLPWGFGTHELYLVPHAFAEANAYYSRDDKALFFGYIDSADGRVYTSLSHDIVAHETAHAILDGLRPDFMKPGLPDQRGFHEAFADIVALLSVFSIKEVVEELIGTADKNGRIPTSLVSKEAFESNPLFKLASQLGNLFSDERGNGLRRSVVLEPGSAWRKDPAFELPHRRGEVLVAAVMRALLDIWLERLTPLARGRDIDRERAAEEGAKAAKHLLTMSIRAIDYTPPAEFEFEDFIAALLRSDREVAPHDTYGYRDILATSFAEFGIRPPAYDTLDLAIDKPIYPGVNFEALRSMTDEMYRFVWANARLLKVDTDNYLNVNDVRPSIRIGPDGLLVSEAVATYSQVMEATAGEVQALSDAQGRRIALPRGMDLDTPISIRGGGTLIFDQFGNLKYHCSKPLFDWRRQKKRLDHLYTCGEKDQYGRYGFSSGDSAGQAFAGLHVPATRAGENW
ncbi:MAG: hypothetical protein HKN44_03670 [Ilumatobacter sp.]|nr:hypothetical protein [Ilumatobacter sp.]